MFKWRVIFSFTHLVPGLMRRGWRLLVVFAMLAVLLVLEVQATPADAQTPTPQRPVATITAHPLGTTNSDGEPQYTIRIQFDLPVKAVSGTVCDGLTLTGVDALGTLNNTTCQRSLKDRPDGTQSDYYRRYEVQVAVSGTENGGTAEFTASLAENVAEARRGIIRGGLNVETGTQRFEAQNVPATTGPSVTLSSRSLGTTPGGTPQYEIKVEFSRGVQSTNFSDIDQGYTESSICTGLNLTGATGIACNVSVQSDETGSVVTPNTDGTFTIGPNKHFRVWTADVLIERPATRGTVDVTVSLDANVAEARDGLRNQASETLTFQVQNVPAADTEQPRVLLIPSDQPITGSFDVEFIFEESDGTNEAVTGFTQSDVRVSGGRATALVALTDAPEGHRYRATVKPNSPSGTNDSIDVQISVAANAAQDAAGNGNTASNFPTLVASPRPTTVIATPSMEGTQTGAFDIRITFSKPVTGFTQSDIRVSYPPDEPTATRGAAQVTSVAEVSGSNGARYTATITPTRSGRLTFSIPNSAATDGESYPSLPGESNYITVELTGGL